MLNGKVFKFNTVLRNHLGVVLYERKKKNKKIYRKKGKHNL